MDKATKIRWTLLGSALAATVAAILYPVDEQPEPWTPRPVATKLTPPSKALVARQEQRRPIWIASDDDPFAPRIWEAPPTPVTAPTVATQAPEQVQAVEAPPPLPYRFLGQMQDGDKRVLYLGRGEQVLLAHQGDVLESAYKVVAVGDSQIEFESIQSGDRQTLPIPAQ